MSAVPGLRPQAEQAVRTWPVWQLPRWLVTFIVAVTGADAVGIVVTAVHATVRAHDLMLFALLLACDAASVELIRRAGESARTGAGMHLVWELPVAILLPVVYAPISPIIRLLLAQWRVRRAPLYRRVFSTAALGLSYLAAALVFHGLVGPVAGGGADLVRRGFTWMTIAAVGGVAQRLVNSALVLTAIKGSDRRVRLRDVQLGRESLYTDITQLCVTVLVAFSMASSPATLIFTFPLATVLLRALRHAQLLNDSRTDSKTGLLNAGTWEREAAAEVTRAVRLRVPLAVAVIDLDWDEPPNQTYGRAFGDEARRQIGQCLSQALREYDSAGRLSGEEFVLLLPQTRAADAIRIADRVRNQIAGIPLRTPDGESMRVTASVGVATLDAGWNRELSELLAAADAALSRAKRHGRNQVQMISSMRGLSATAGLGKEFAATPAPRAASKVGTETGKVTPNTARVTSETPKVTPGAVRLLAIAAQVLPAADRDRFAEEYRAELREIANVGLGRGRQLLYAARQLKAARQLRRELRAPHRRRAEP
jgi:diguanylate cyclase (GGDEF)-like protein